MTVEGPLLVVVGGAPASGKTTLALRLGGALALPVLSKDAIKEALYDSVGALTPERSQALGRAAYAVLFRVVASLLEAQVSLVLESNFERGRSEEELRNLLGKARGVLIHCQAPAAQTVQRYGDRRLLGARHAGHHDVAALPRLVANLEAGAYEPPDLGIPTLRVDTSAGYVPGMESILAFVRGR